jgi:hypothetical protein
VTSYPVAAVRSGQRRHKQLRVFLPLTLPFAILVGVAVFTPLTLNEGAAPSAPGRPGALLWGDGIFANTFELKAWLRQHGSSYSRWERQHPAAAHLVTHKPVKRTRRQTAANVPRAAVAVKRHGSARPVPAVASTAKLTAERGSQAQPQSPTGAGRSLGLMILLVSLGLLALGAAMLPRRLLKRLAPSPPVAEVRVGLAAAGAAMLCGIAIALLLS